MVSDHPLMLAVLAVQDRDLRRPLHEQKLAEPPHARRLQLKTRVRRRELLLTQKLKLPRLSTVCLKGLPDTMHSERLLTD